MDCFKQLPRILFLRRAETWRCHPPYDSLEVKGRCFGGVDALLLELAIVHLETEYGGKNVRSLRFGQGTHLRCIRLLLPASEHGAKGYVLLDQTTHPSPTKAVRPEEDLDRVITLH